MSSTPSSAPSKSSKGTTSTNSHLSSRPARSSNHLTPTQQDRQARNKSPYSSSEESSDSGWEDRRGEESYERTQKRREAAIVLDNPELLMMHAQARFDSIPGTRHFFTKQLLGFEDEKNVVKPVLKGGAGKEKGREKEKMVVGSASGSKRSA